MFLAGLEKIALQGIPINDLLLTRETEDQLADLAGNAMTCTVVGAAMIAALALNAKFLTTAPWADKHRDSGNIYSRSGDQELKVTGDVALVDKPLQLNASSQATVHEILDAGMRSSRKCDCHCEVYSFRVVAAIRGV